jgi:hypothetical protein
MKMKELREIAKTWQVDARAVRSRQDIVRDIQQREGFEPCFRTRTVCDQRGCLWREDCIGKK